MRLYLCFWLAGIYTYNGHPSNSNPIPRCPPAMSRAPHLCLSIMGSDKEVAPSFRRRLSWHTGACTQRVAGQAFNMHRCAVTSHRRRVLGRPLSGHGRARRLGCDDKSNGNGVAHPKSQFAAVACVPGFTLAWVVMRCTRAPVRSGGSPSTSDVHAVDKERRKSITTRATPRAGSHAGTLKVGR